MKTFFRVGIIFSLLLLASCNGHKPKSDSAEGPANDSLTAMEKKQANDSLQTPTLSQISEYDDLIRAEATKIGWDWRLIASLIYQESRFKPHLINHKGAFGLMQLMPSTMEKYHIDHNATVEQQLEAGGKLLVHLDKKLSTVVTDSLERVNFILASYNAGFSRVMNYREQTQENGGNPNVWFDNVECYSPRQTVAFVREITERYSYYKASIE